MKRTNHEAGSASALASNRDASIKTSKATMAKQRIPKKDSKAGNNEIKCYSAINGLLESKCKVNFEVQGEDNPSLSRNYHNATRMRADLHPASSISDQWWTKGPADSAGAVVNLSDRPSLCMSVMGSQAAIGSSDHAVYTVDIPTAHFRKALYGKNQGHTEWVTCISHLPDGRILSGGMDSKLCLWDRTGARCTDLKAHTASISGVKASGRSIAVSSSYDKSIMIWDLNIGKGSKINHKPLASLHGHRAAVMAFALGANINSNSINIASGCRDGAVILWDGHTGSVVLHCKQAHSGHVTALECLHDEDDGGPSMGEMFLSGGQDGVLQVWDFRTKAPVHTAVLHSKGQGALSCISVARKSACGCPLIVTGGADKMMKVVDPRSSFRVIHSLSEHRDFIYSLFASGSIAWSGGGDGSLLVHDLVNGKCLYGLGASSNGAVRCISLANVHQGYLVCTGDDGNVIIYSNS